MLTMNFNIVDNVPNVGSESFDPVSGRDSSTQALLDCYTKRVDRFDVNIFMYMDCRLLVRRFRE